MISSMCPSVEMYKKNRDKMHAVGAVATTAIVFIVQHLFDEAQIIADNVGPPVTRQQWQYLYRLGIDVRNSLSNVS